MDRPSDDLGGGFPPDLREFMRDLMKPPSPSSTGFDAGAVVLKSVFAVSTMVRAFVANANAFLHKVNPPPPPGAGDIPPNVARMLRMHLESVEKKTESFVDLAEQLIVSVRSAVNSSVRNEIHLKRIEDRVLNIEAKVEEAVTSGKEAADYLKQNSLLPEKSYSSLKSTLDSVLEEVKSSSKGKTHDLVQKPWFEMYDEALNNFNEFTSFPDRVIGQVNKIVRYATFLEVLLTTIGSPTSPKIKQVVINLKELKGSCNGIALINGTYSEIGKKASDLLYKYYVTGVTAVISADPTDQSIFNLSMDNGLLADLTLETKATLDDNIMEVTLNVQNLYSPSLKGSLTTPLPWRSPEAHLHFLHDFGAIDMKVDLTRSPTLNLSMLFGVNAFSVGGDLAVNTSGVFSKYDAGLSITHNDFCASLKLQDKFQQVSASVFGKVNLVSFALEYIHNLSEILSSDKEEKEKKEKKPKHKIVAGISGMLNPATELKAFVDTDCMAGCAVQHRWRPQSAVALSCKVNMKQINAPQFGLSMEFGLKSR